MAGSNCEAVQIEAELLCVGESGSGTVIQTGGYLRRTRPHRRRPDRRRNVHQRRHHRRGVAPFQIAESGATGTLRVSGTATVTHGAEMIIADDTNTGSNGRLELIGSQATFRIGQLDNVAGGANGMRETIRWQADTGGVTPITITGMGLSLQSRSPSKCVRARRRHRYGTLTCR